MTKYSKEFKEEALKLSDEIGVKKAALQLGLQYYTLADWRKDRKHTEKHAVILTENIFFTNLNIRARRALEICVAHGENPLPNECHIDNISFDNVMLCPREDNILHGFKHSRLTNVKLSNVTVKNVGEISIKNADGIVFDGFRDLSETPCNITAQDCTDVYVNGKMI